jgi:hypothetical protein
MLAFCREERPVIFPFRVTGATTLIRLGRCCLSGHNHGSDQLFLSTVAPFGVLWGDFIAWPTLLCPVSFFAAAAEKFGEPAACKGPAFAPARHQKLLAY